MNSSYNIMRKIGLNLMLEDREKNKKRNNIKYTGKASAFTVQ